MANKTGRGGARAVTRPDDKRVGKGYIKKDGRPPVKIELRVGTRLAVVLDNVTEEWGEVYDIERIGNRRVVRWKADSDGRIVILSVL